MDKLVWLERIRPALADRAYIKSEILKATKRSEKNIAGCGNNIRGVCAG